MNTPQMHSLFMTLVNLGLSTVLNEKDSFKVNAIQVVAFTGNVSTGKKD